MVSAAIEAFGYVDILVNNAGVRASGLFGEFSYETFDTAIAVNLRAPFFASQAVIPSMRTRGSGRIVHVASQHSIVASRERALYGATKAALAYLARGMAFELSAYNILVNAISPGPISSEAYLQRVVDDPEFGRNRLNKIPLGRVGTPSEVAAAVAFLTSDDASLVQGHNLVIDGGYIIH